MINLQPMINRQIAQIKRAVQHIRTQNHAGNSTGMQRVAQSISKNIDVPTTPITCNGTSFQCNVSGSGTTPITPVATRPQGYDFLASNMQEGGRLGVNYANNTILNCRQNSICTPFTNDSLRNTIGFENFQ
jgi:hypothetical protein